jgi:hypothetical protein
MCPSPGANCGAARATDKKIDHVNRGHPISQGGVQAEDARLIGDVTGLGFGVH